MSEFQFSGKDFEQLDLNFKRNFINSLSGFKGIALCGTISKEGKTNLAIFNTVVHVGANPPLLGFISRPENVRRDTLTNIRETGFFTLNHIKSEIYIKAHQTAARYISDKSEFDMVGLTPKYSDNLPVPYVKESSVKIGLKFAEEITIKSNNTIFIVGEIVETFVPNSAILSDGLLDLNITGSLTASGLDTYYSCQKIARLSFAKPDQDLNIIG